MKRAIKYWNQYDSEKAGFSTCGTKYEILPGLYPDSAGYPELEKLAESFGVNDSVSADLSRRAESYVKVTESVVLTDQYLEKSDGHCFKPTIKKHQWYLGFVQLTDSKLFPALETSGNAVPESVRDGIQDLLGCSDLSKLGIDDIGHHSQDDETLLVMAGWHYFHVIPLLGYDLDSFREIMGVKQESFYDSVTCCNECFEFDDNDNGYTYNFRNTEDGSYGIRCGCFAEYALKNVDQYANESSKAIELDIAEKLESQGRLKHIERFIGGMTDGRGGRYAGEFTREGNPKDILSGLLKANPKKQYVFTHDESGQFQTYFSIWELKPAKKSKRRKAGKGRISA